VPVTVIAVWPAGMLASIQTAEQLADALATSSCSICFDSAELPSVMPVTEQVPVLPCPAEPAYATMTVLPSPVGCEKVAELPPRTTIFWTR
jgi:hypothetical protein